MTGFLNILRRSGVPLAAAVTLTHFNAAAAQNAEAYYVDNIAALVQESCINCHYAGGIGPSLKFTGSSLLRPSAVRQLREYSDPRCES